MLFRQSRPSRRLGMENQSRRSLLLWEVRKIFDSVLRLIFIRVHFVGSSFQEETNKVLTDGNCGIEFNIGKPKISQMKWKSSESIQSKVSTKRQNKKTQKSFDFKLNRTLLLVRRICRKCLEKSSSFSMNINHEKLKHPHICQICVMFFFFQTFSFVQIFGERMPSSSKLYLKLI